jgi:hypothetical protein
MLPQVSIAQDRTQHLRKIMACFKKLADLCEVRRLQMQRFTDPCLWTTSITHHLNRRAVTSGWR